MSTKFCKSNHLSVFLPSFLVALHSLRKLSTAFNEVGEHLDEGFQPLVKLVICWFIDQLLLMDDLKNWHDFKHETLGNSQELFLFIFVSISFGDVQWNGQTRAE